MAMVQPPPGTQARNAGSLQGQPRTPLQQRAQMGGMPTPGTPGMRQKPQSQVNWMQMLMQALQGNQQQQALRPGPASYMYDDDPNLARTGAGLPPGRGRVRAQQTPYAAQPYTGVKPVFYRKR